MAVFILGDSFTLEHKGKLGSEHYKRLMYKLHCNLLTLEEGLYHFCIRKLKLSLKTMYFILPTTIIIVFSLLTTSPAVIF